MTKTKTVGEAIVSTLQGRVRPLTSVDIATKTGHKVSSVRRTINDLLFEGAVQIISVDYTGGIGRPAQKYLLT